jgi:hypothetical protein
MTIRDKNERCFVCGPREDCLLDNCVVTRLTHVEAGWNTSTSLRVVGGDEKEVSNLRQ